MAGRNFTRIAAALSFALLSAGCPKTIDPDSTITSIYLTPAAQAIEAGQTLQFIATANLSDGSSQVLSSSVSWASSDAAVATVDSTGLATGVAGATGVTTISATYGGRSGSTTLNVECLLKSIAIDGPAGALPDGFDYQLQLLATWSGNTTAPVTSGVTWTSYKPWVATVDAAGVVHGVASGTTTLTASYAGMTTTFLLTVSSATLSSVALAPATATLTAGGTVQLQLLGTFSDASTLALAPTSAVWTDDGSGHAQVDATGLVTTAVSALPGTTTVTATVGGLSATAAVTVNAATLLSVEIAPATATVPAGRTVQYSVTATYDSGPQPIAGADVSWNAGGATVVDGLVSSTTPANYTITAWYGGRSATAALTVTDAVVDQVVLSPGSATIQVGATQQYTADVTWSDGQVTHAATFSSSDAGVASIDPSSGLATGVAAGTATITATAGGVADTATLEVQTGPVGPVGPALDGYVVYPGDFPWSTTHTSVDAMLYEVTGLTPGQAYEVPITGLTGDASVEIFAFADRLFTDEIGDGYAWVDPYGSGGTPLRFVADADGTIYLQVYSGLGTTWTLGTPTAYVGPTLTGTLYYPSSFPYSAPSGSSDRFYRITGLIPGAAYAVDLTTTAGYDLAAYSNSAFLAPSCGGGGWAVTSCAFVAGAAGDVYVQVFSHGTTGTFSLDVVTLAAVTPSATLVFPTSFAYASSVTAGGVVWYRVTGLDPSAPFLFAIDGGPVLWVFGDVYATDRLCEADSYWGPDACFARPPASGEVWIAVDGRSLGGAFTLQFSSLGPAGTLVYPGPFPFSSSAAPLSAVVWQVTGLTPGATYAFEVGGVDEPVSAGVVPDPSFVKSLCWASAGLAVDGLCLFTAPASGVVYLAIDASGTSGTPYMFDVTPVASATPTVLLYPGDFAFAGSVGTGESLYQVTGLTPNQRYTVSLSGLSADADLYVYENSIFAGMDCGSANAGTTAESCDAWADGSGAAYVLVSGRNTGAGATFALDIAPWVAPWVAVALPVDLPYAASVGTGYAYYQLTGLTPSVAYQIVFETPTDDVDLHVFADAAMTVPLCTSAAAGVVEEYCGVTAGGSGTVYVVADGTPSAAGVSFTLAAYEVPAGVSLRYGIDTPWVDWVDTSFRLYEITGLTAGNVLSVFLTSMTDNGDLFVFHDAALTRPGCQSTTVGTWNESCNVLTEGTSVWVLVDGSLTASGTVFTLDVY